MVTNAAYLTIAPALSWSAILPDVLSASARSAVTDILVALKSPSYDDGSALYAADLALLYGYLAVVERSEHWQERTAEYLNQAIDRVSAANNNYVGLFGGLAGVGWTIEHVSRLLTGDVEPDALLEDPISDIDDALIRRLRQTSWEDVYDLIGGLVGIGVYFVERLPRPAALEGLGLVVRHLDALAEESWGGLAWHTPPHHIWSEQRDTFPDGYYNLGVAHGIPGILQLLAEAIRHGVESTVASRLLDGGVKWLAGRERPPDALSRYSCWFVPGREPDDSRLAWCYGDLGIAAVWLHAGRAVGRSDWVTAALKLLDRALEWPVERDRIIDTPLCHGACGVAHVCNRVYHTTGHDRYRIAANKWYTRALQMRVPGEGIAGFPAWRLDKTPHLHPDPSFLAGAIGVVLALSAATCPVEPNWDRLLLISGR